MDEIHSKAAEFFSSSPSPGDLETVKRDVESFVLQHRKVGRKIALVTSGGTTVPLEANTVRFIDNFSTGSRGSASAEYFIANGYAVIFLHRKGSLQPYHRRFQCLSLLDVMDINETSGELVVSANLDGLKSTIIKYKEVQSSNMLCNVSYTSVFEYLHYLQAICPLLNFTGSLVYLAAAVSDFYIHPSRMTEHKMPSDSMLTLQLDLVPKMIPLITSSWSPRAFVISFKLETDSNVLLKSAHKSLRKYGQQMVIANLLDRRKDEVTIVDKDGKETIIELTSDELKRGIEIEERIISFICRYH